MLPTGTGKSVVFAQLAREAADLGERTLILAHRTELLEQAVKHCERAGVHAQLEQGSRRAGSAPVVVASVASLRRKRLEQRFAPTAFRRIIVDEGHHGAAASYRAILEYFTAPEVLLVTATPDRGDGQALSAICSSVAYRYELRQAIHDRHLAPLRARRIVVDGISLASVRVHHGDFDQRQLAAVLSAERALHGVVVPLLEQAGDRRTIVFGVDVAHAHALAELLCRYRPGCARAVDGTAHRDARRGVLAGFAAGEFQFLVNCALFTEGFDEPSIACVAVVRPTRSRALYVQMVGRGTRLAPGKRDLLVLDFCGNSGRHRLIGPADALAGAVLADDVRDQVELDLAAEQLELEEVLAHADQEVARRGAELRVRALADYRAREVDPFLGDFAQVTPSGSWVDGPRGDLPATVNQRAALTRAGLNLDRIQDSITQRMASQWLDAIAERARLGLCSVKSARFLERMNFDTRGMTAERAKELTHQLRVVRYRHPLLASEPEYKPGWTPKTKWGRSRGGAP